MQSGLAVAEKLYADFAAGDIKSVLGAMADDIVWNEAENFPYADKNPYIGPNAVVAGLFARLGGEWNGWSANVEAMMADGDKVAAFGRYKAVHKETGKAIDAQFVHVWTFRNGKAVAFQQYADTAQVSAAVRSE